jgi:hypothetical protein
LTARLPEFIALTEGRIAYGGDAPIKSEPLRVRAMETSADVTVSAQTAALPTGFLAIRRLYLNTNPIGELEYVTPDLFWRTYISTTSDQPRRFTIEGENFVFGPTPDSAYTGKCLYYKKFTALASDSDTNWILTNAPGLYLHGALAELYAFARNSQKAAEELSIFAGLINALNNSDKSDRYSSPWVAHGDTGNP